MKSTAAAGVLACTACWMRVSSIVELRVVNRLAAMRFSVDSSAQLSQ